MDTRCILRVKRQMEQYRRSEESRCTTIGLRSHSAGDLYIFVKCVCIALVAVVLQR